MIAGSLPSLPLRTLHTHVALQLLQPKRLALHPVELRVQIDTTHAVSPTGSGDGSIQRLSDLYRALTGADAEGNQYFRVYDGLPDDRDYAWRTASHLGAMRLRVAARREHLVVGPRDWLLLSEPKRRSNPPMQTTHAVHKILHDYAA